MLLIHLGKAGKQFVIKLHPSLSEGTFKPQRFSPNKNNVRQHWFKGEEGVADDADGEFTLSRTKMCHYVHVDRYYISLKFHVVMYRVHVYLNIVIIYNPPSFILITVLN